MELPVEPTRVLDIAVVGLGTRSRKHIETIRSLSDFYRLAAVCDALPGKAAEIGAELGVPGFEHLDEMLSKTRLDVVLVTAPPEYHHTISCRVAQAGVNVLCETPIAIALPYADDMIADAEKNGVKIQVAENVVRFPVERFKRMLIESGMLGEPRVVRMRYSSGAYHGMSAVRNLITAPPTRAMGIARLMGAPKRVRYVDPFYFRTFGPPNTEPPAYLSETDVAAWEMGMIEFADGCVAGYEAPIASSTGNEWELQTTLGWMSRAEVVLAEDPVRRFQIVTESEGEDDDQVLTSVRLYDGDNPVSDVVWHNPYIRYKPQGPDDVARMDQLLDLYRAVTEGGEPEYDGLEGRKDMELLIAVRESARLLGEPVPLPLTDVTGYEERLFPVYGDPITRPPKEDAV